MARSVFASILLFVALVVVGLTSSNAQVTVNCSTSVSLNVTGNLTCLSLGIPPTTIPVVGANVALVCNGKVVAQATTNSLGTYQLSGNVSNLIPLNISSCYLNITLPLNSSCIIPPAGSAIQVPLNIISMTVQQVGSIINMVLMAVGSIIRLM